MNSMHNRNGTILGANGAPTKINVAVQYSPGPLAAPVVLPPINAESGFVAPAFGGATRMETVASRLLAGAMAHNTLGRCGEDTDYRRRLIEASVITAWELIGAASEFRGPPAHDHLPSDPPADAPEKETEETNQAEKRPEPENPPRIILLD